MENTTVKNKGFDNENIKVSIVIACYNDVLVKEAIESALDQTYSFKEIIVVNDGSSDKTSEIIENYRSVIDIIIHQENSGQSVARNNGIKKATGDLILNLDSDDYFEPTFCEKAVQRFNLDEEVKIVTCKARRFDHAGTIDIFTPKGGGLKDFLFSNSALGSSMYRKTDWETTKGYEEKLPILGFEDWEFYIQLLKKGGYAYVIPEVLFNYRIRKNSTTHRIRFQKHDMFKYIIEKHDKLYQDHFPEL
ncbi:MAG: glycosyltransferase, partial [Candidatus Bathyarchaeota archaeon]|nr:glycosyltransferase [Candidatus Bathyarchaeota archaeon]